MVRSVIDKISKDLFNSNEDSTAIEIIVDYLRKENCISLSIKEDLDTDGLPTIENATIKNNREDVILQVEYKNGDLCSCDYFLENCVDYNCGVFHMFMEEIKSMNSDLLNKLNSNKSGKNSVLVEFNRVDSAGDLYDQEMVFDVCNNDLELLVEEIIYNYSRMLYMDFLVAFGDNKSESVNHLDSFIENDFIVKVIN